MLGSALRRVDEGEPPLLGLRWVPSEVRLVRAEAEPGHATSQLELEEQLREAHSALRVKDKQIRWLKELAVDEDTEARGQEHEQEVAQIRAVAEWRHNVLRLRLSKLALALRALEAQGAGLLVLDRDANEAKPIAKLGQTQLEVVAHPRELSGEVDALLVTVKTWQLEACLPQIVDTLRASPGAVVIPFCNGVTATEVIRDALRSSDLPGAAERVVSGIAKCIAYVGRPGTVVLQREIGVQLGPGGATLDQKKLAILSGVRDALAHAGISAALEESPDTMTAELWRKFLVTGCLGPISAATRAPIDVILSMPETRALSLDSMNEAMAVGAALGVNLPADTPQKTLDYIAGHAEPGATYSTTRDVVGGRPSEILEFCGTLVELGAKHGVPTPVHSQLLATLLPQERLARGEITYTLTGAN